MAPDDLEYMPPQENAPDDVGGANMLVTPADMGQYWTSKTAAVDRTDPSGSGYALPQGQQQITGSPGSTPQVAEPSTFNRIALALEGFGAGFRGQKPLAFHIAQQEAVQQQHRDAMLQRQQQQMETRRLKEADQAIKIAFDDKTPFATRVKGLEALGTDHARQLAQALTKDFASRGKADEKYLTPRGQQLLKQWYANANDPNATMADLEAEFDIAHERRMQTSKQESEASLIGGLKDKLANGEPLGRDEHTILKKALDEEDKRKIELQEMRSRLKVSEATEQPKIDQAQAEAKSAGVKSRVDVATEYAQANKIKAEGNKANAPTVSPMFVVDDQGTVAHYITDKDGNTKMVLGKPIQRTQDMSNAMLAKRSELVALKRQTEDLWDKFKPEFAGRWDAIRMGLQGATNTLPPDAAAFVTSWDTYVKALRKEALGTAQSARELSTNKYAFPELSQGETVVTEFMKNQHKQIVTKLQAQRDVVDEARRKDPAMASKRLEQLKAMAPMLYKSKEEAQQAIGEIMADELSRGLLIDDHGK